MNVSPEKQVLKELAAQSPEMAKLFQTIIENAPQFADMVPALLRGVERVVKKKVEYKLYPERGQTRELIVWVKHMHDMNYPFTFNFNDGSG